MRDKAETRRLSGCKAAPHGGEMYFVAPLFQDEESKFELDVFISLI